MYQINPKMVKQELVKAKNPETCPFGNEYHSENLNEI